ncbi:hypothetical protein AK812_SmicGene14507 [Symbiodinium microadriaticum]|uniref:Uncharacterized protein n=1 Tax=Symbiodinium microadriaticum TaxID=2951 RepID=A0A1Q9E5B9_SYMMI|nr:hypothetical protein AK812_SmicGene14507 [Symbiodinium microadriaticum]
MLHYPFSLETPNCSVRDFLGVGSSSWPSPSSKISRSHCTESAPRGDAMCNKQNDNDQVIQLFDKYVLRRCGHRFDMGREGCSATLGGANMGMCEDGV